MSSCSVSPQPLGPVWQQQVQEGAGRGRSTPARRGGQEELLVEGQDRRRRRQRRRRPQAELLGQHASALPRKQRRLPQLLHLLKFLHKEINKLWKGKEIDLSGFSVYPVPRLRMGVYILRQFCLRFCTNHISPFFFCLCIHNLLSPSVFAIRTSSIISFSSEMHNFFIFCFHFCLFLFLMVESLSRVRCF